MLMRTEFVDLRFCAQCGRATEQIRFIYLDEGTVTCQVCQNTEDFIVAEELVNKKFAIVSMDGEVSTTDKRRVVKVEVRVTLTPDKLGEGSEVTYEDIKVEYPAYGDDHFTAQVSHCGVYGSGSVPGFKDAKGISKAIKQFIGKEEI